MERWATFDCYGTLIDWNGGIRRELARVFDEERADELLARYHEVEPQLEADGTPKRSTSSCLPPSERFSGQVPRLQHAHGCRPRPELRVPRVRPRVRRRARPRPAGVGRRRRRNG